MKNPPTQFWRVFVMMVLILMILVKWSIIVIVIMGRLRRVRRMVVWSFMFRDFLCVGFMLLVENYTILIMRRGI